MIIITTGDKIKTLRLVNGMTQEELGSKIGVQKAAINKYETGLVVNLKRTRLISLASALSVSATDLLDDDLSQEEFLKLIAEKNVERELLRIYRSLPLPGKNALNQMAQLLKETYLRNPNSSKE